MFRHLFAFRICTDRTLDSYRSHHDAFHHAVFTPSNIWRGASTQDTRVVVLTLTTIQNLRIAITFIDEGEQTGSDMSPKVNAIPYFIRGYLL